MTIEQRLEQLWFELPESARGRYTLHAVQEMKASGEWDSMSREARCKEAYERSRIAFAKDLISKKFDGPKFPPAVKDSGDCASLRRRRRLGPSHRGAVA